MRLILVLLIITACTALPRREAPPAPIPEQKPIIEQPAPKKERPVTIITVHPPAKPQPVCVPMAASERKQILQALECLIEADKTKR